MKRNNENYEKIIAEKDREIRSLKRRLESYEQYIAENRAMRSEQIVAEQIQRSMLPSAYPAFPEHPGIDLYADMDAANETGGDFYDFFPIDGSHIYFGVSDIEGKGIPAAMYMAVTKSMIKLRLQSGEDIESVYNEVNKQLCASSMQKRFVTSWSAVLDVETGSMRCVNAGHNYPVVLRSNGGTELIKQRSGLPLASYFSEKRRITYTSFDYKLNDGDILILYTDGVTEAHNSADESFGDARLTAAVQTYMADKHSMRELTAYIRRRVIAFMDHAGQDDDITLLAVRYSL